SRTRSPETGPQNNAFSDATKEVSREPYCYRSEPEQIPNLRTCRRRNNRRRTGLADTQPAAVSGEMWAKSRDRRVILRSLRGRRHRQEAWSRTDGRPIAARAIAGRRRSRCEER